MHTRDLFQSAPPIYYTYINGHHARQYRACAHTFLFVYGFIEKNKNKTVLNATTPPIIGRDYNRDAKDRAFYRTLLKRQKLHCSVLFILVAMWLMYRVYIDQSGRGIINTRARVHKALRS